ncbi:hypothetical protein [Candidatus Solirubrobacter pratensis]|uniref:hypothetical protein n=1 Tax=Candidatus Solirubrobacter pratensis TaxID=1298857 RepID=UPI000424E360|nr:hypothetical protein [Candidatus Solirubrobacter pratensis]
MPAATDTADRTADVFIPAEFATWQPPPGSGIVGSLATARLVVNYEDEADTYADRVRIAWGHFIAQTPTTKRRELRRFDVIAVGTYDARDGQVVVDSYLSELVMRFLAIDPDARHATEALKRECQSTHTQHQRRRHIRQLLAGAGKNRAQAEAARECAHRYGHDDLLT